MSDDYGWIQAHRKMAQSELWTAEPFTRGQAWFDMLLLTNHKDGYIRVRGNRVLVKRGQLGWSLTKLASRWKWGRSKVTRFMNELETDQQIVQQKSNVSSLITIVNYEKYQGKRAAERTADDTADSTADEPQTSRRPYTNNNENNGNNEKKEKRGAFRPPTLDELKDYIQEKSLKVDPERFIDFYQSKNWMIGKNKMKDWKAAVRNWARGDNSTQPGTTRPRRPLQ